MNDTTLDPRCGTYAGAVRHSKLHEKKCEPCMQAQREYRRKIKLPRTKPPVIRNKCGTSAGYKAHEKHGEFTCNPCRLAINEVVRLRNQKIKELRAKKSREYRANNKDHVRAVEAEWRKNNKDKKRNKDYLRSARKRTNGRADKFTIDDVLNLYGTICYLCGKAIDLQAERRGGLEGWERGLHIDHVIPLVKGGEHILENVRPTHGACNLKKGTN